MPITPINGKKAIGSKLVTARGKAEEIQKIDMSRMTKPVFASYNQPIK